MSDHRREFERACDANDIQRARELFATVSLGHTDAAWYIRTASGGLIAHVLFAWTWWLTFRGVPWQKPHRLST